MSTRFVHAAIPPPADTTPEPWAAQAEMRRRFGEPRRSAAAFRHTAFARDAARSGIRSRHPGYADEVPPRTTPTSSSGWERQLEDVAGTLVASGDRPGCAYLGRWAAALGVADVWRKAAEGT